MDHFQSNMAVIASRWPKIAEVIHEKLTGEPLAWRTGTPESTLVFSGIHLTSAYNRGHEAALQATLIPDESREGTVYGVALGDLQRALLGRESLCRLRVVIMNPSVAATCLAAASHDDWLEDDRISLHLGSEEDDISMPFAAAPATLHLASDDCLVLRDRIAQALASPFESHHFRQLDAVLDARLEENISFVKNDGDVFSLYGKATGKPVVVVAAGPTAESQFEWMRSKRPEQCVLVVSTALSPLLSAGIVPDAVLVIDPKDEILDHFEHIDREALRHVPLVYLPTVRADVLNAWPGPRLTAYIKRERFERIRKTYPKGVLHCEGTVTHVAVDLAVRMGASSIILVGTDFSFPEHTTHLVGAAHRRHVDDANTGSAPEVINGYGARNISRPDMVGFLRALEKYIAVHDEVTFFNTGRAGADIAGTVWLDGRG